MEWGCSRLTYRTPYQPQYCLERQPSCNMSIVELDNFTNTNAEPFSFDTVQRNKDGYESSLHSNTTDLVEGQKLSSGRNAYTISTPFLAHQHGNDQHFTVAVSSKIPSVVAWPELRTSIDNKFSRSLLLGSMNPEPVTSHTMSSQMCELSSPPIFSIPNHIPWTLVESNVGSLERSTSCVEHEVLQSNYTSPPYDLDISKPFLKVSVEAVVDPGLGQSSPVFRNIEPNSCSSTMLCISKSTVFVSIEQELSIPNSSFGIGEGITKNYCMELPIMGNSISTQPTWISLEPVKTSLESETVIRNAVGGAINTEYPGKLEISRTVLVSFSPELIKLSPAFVHLEAQHENNPQLDISTALPLISVWPECGLPDLPSGFQQVSVQNALASPPIVSYIHFQEESSSDPIDFSGKTGRVPLGGERSSDGLRPRRTSSSTVSSIIHFGSAASSPDKVLGSDNESSSNPLNFEES